MGDDFDSFFDDTNFEKVSDDHDVATHGERLQEQQPVHSRRELRERRRKLSKRRNLRVIFIVVFVVMALVVVFTVRSVASRRGTSPDSQQSTAEALDYYDSQEGEEVQFTVNSGEDASTIAQHLVQQDIVKTTEGFLHAVNAQNAGSKLQPGVFTLRKHMSSTSVVGVLIDTSAAQGILQVKSGETVSDVINAAAAASGIDVSQFQAIISAGGNSILPDEAGGSYEGWFEPGSYNVSDSSTTAQSVITQLVQARIAKLDELGIPEGQREEKINVASIIENEVNKDEYRGKVARVIYNRLEQDMPLGMDSVVAYGNGVESSQLTDAMLNDPSNPYNDRVNEGLPPTPISNPGDASLSAAMSPEEGDWLYFCTVNLQTGETKFTASEDEFYQFRDEYKQWLAANGLDG
ncbi:endolytic transglycosylase MltG [Pseudoscardovia suis]|uniref:endolytic transglycosylase MltG n=1 Tax=Pseudoscardovia suis TaxID=987063 RepID=UPI003F9D2ABC